MGQRSARRLGTLTAVAGVVAGAVVAAPAAGAAEPGIRRPTMTVVCAKPHHGRNFTAARFTQRGKWVAGGQVVVTISRTDTALPQATLRTRTGPGGWFHLARTVTAHDGEPWVAGSNYSWTTTIYGPTWATARRGSVTLTGSC